MSRKPQILVTVAFSYDASVDDAKNIGRFKSALLKAGVRAYRKRYPRGPSKGGVAKELDPTSEEVQAACQAIWNSLPKAQRTHYNLIRQLQLKPMFINDKTNEAYCEATVSKAVSTFLERRPITELCTTTPIIKRLRVMKRLGSPEFDHLDRPLNDDERNVVNTLLQTLTLEQLNAALDLDLAIRAAEKRKRTTRKNY